ncbi:response regulator [Noviherbaspirillum sp. ST9]|uniref:response regulator n=1 Tax=Noviherbaspirillum sp. ST9 TaxID=3401606 RepID=UPI003B585D2F
MNVPAYRIAVVDDDDQLRRALARLLRAHGYTPLEFASAEEYLAAGPQVACLLLDIDLGGMTGIDLYRQLRAMPGEAPPAIFMTGAGTPAAERAAAEMACVAYLAKPVDINVLLIAIEQAVRR